MPDLSALHLEYVATSYRSVVTLFYLMILLVTYFNQLVSIFFSFIVINDYIESPKDCKWYKVF